MLKMHLLRLGFLLICVLAVATSQTTEDLEEEFHLFLLRYGKSYDNAAEHQRRLRIYADNRQMITEHNRRHALGQTSYTMAINRFADMLPHEYRQGCVLKGSRPPGQWLDERSDSDVDSPDPLPATVDWRLKGAVTPVKNQILCGSCWAFAASGSLEGQHFRKTGHLVRLSEQNLVDCSRPFGNEGCVGGLPDLALEYVLKNGGIDTEQSYPYAFFEGRCRFQNRTIGATVKAIKELPHGDENELQVAVANVGPVAVSIDASHRSFQLYSGGVYDEPACNTTNLDHAVLAVGYGTDATGGDYWLVKNSWGVDWGDAGYIRMSRGRDNQCGIASSACYPVV